jgi:predicted ArsR family transcriptional regulator
MDGDPDDDVDGQLHSVAALGDPIRRSLYQFVSTQARPVTREQAAAGTGVAVHVAKFHLDRLETEGLLEGDYARPDGRTGPGAGRPAKVYRRTARDIAVSLPPRRYELAGQIMATAITATQRTSVPLDRALDEAAESLGRTIGAETRSRARGAGGSVPEALAAHGFEPRDAGDRIVLANCPFHRLAETFTDLICGVNLTFVRGVVSGAGDDSLTAELVPRPNQCCVTLVRSADSTG